MHALSSGGCHTRAMTEWTRTIRYTGSAAGADALTDTLQEHAVEVVDWLGGYEERKTGADAMIVGLRILVYGAYDNTTAAMRDFCERFPRAEVVMEDDDSGGPDDGGFLPS
jgi:hypothetical protein